MGQFTGCGEGEDLGDNQDITACVITGLQIRTVGDWQRVENTANPFFYLSLATFLSSS